MREHGIVAPLALGILAGVCLGVGAYTFGYARGYSYLTDDPGACANCHIMREQVAGWRKGSHRKAAVCNDCHTPLGVVPKYGVKALNGFFHSLAFTSGRFPDQIEITKFDAQVAESACMKCHAEITSEIRGARGHGREPVGCIRCHRRVGHA
jgi:cytochrome c nitrite reductase small subunit